MNVFGTTRIRVLFLLVTAAVFIAAVLSLGVGKFPIAPSDLPALFRNDPAISELARRVFFTLRLPRTVMTILSGVAMGMAGAVYQLIFKNPLASPDIIGVAGGANLGAAIAIVTGSASGMLSIAMGAFWGGLAAVFFVMLLIRATGARQTATYVLAGIVINAVARSLIMTLKYFADPENELAAMEYWEMGTFGNVTQSKVLAILPLFLIGITGIFLLRRQIEMLSLGDQEAKALGVRLQPVRAAILLLSTLLVTSVISVTGLISFAGLIAPHTARMMLQRNDAVTLLMSGFVGALIVLVADILARSLYSTELPISILTSVIGVPMLVYLLRRRRGMML